MRTISTIGAWLSKASWHIKKLVTLHTWSPGQRSRYLRICALAFALALGALAAIDPAVARTAYPGGKWEPGPARYGAVLADDVTLTMDDGVVLEVSIAYPTHKATGRRASGRFPVLIEHSLYVQLCAPIRPLTSIAKAQGSNEVEIYETEAQK